MIKKTEFLTGIGSFVLLKLFVWFLKYLINTPRPPSADLWMYNPSFPSGVAADAGFIACFLSWKYPKLWLLFHSIGVVLSYSRVYTGDHYVVDIVGEYIIGILWFFLYSRIMRTFLRS